MIKNLTLKTDSNVTLPAVKVEQGYLTEIASWVNGEGHWSQTGIDRFRFIEFEDEAFGPVRTFLGDWVVENVDGNFVVLDDEVVKEAFTVGV